MDRWCAHLQSLPSGQGATKVTSWIIFDGDIDPGWIESLNSVLGREKGTVDGTGQLLELHITCVSERERRDSVHLKDGHALPQVSACDTKHKPVTGMKECAL